MWSNGWRRVLAGAVAAVLLFSMAVAQEPEGGGEAKTYPDGADGLKQLFQDILAKAQAGEEDAVKGMLEKMLMTADDFTAILGERGAEVATKYAEKYAKHWPNEAKNISGKVKDRGYDDVEVNEVTASPDQQTGEDKKVVAALKEGTKMFSVRLKKKGEKSGLRYDSFFYVNGAWKTGLKLGKLVGAAGGEKKSDEKKSEGDK